MATATGWSALLFARHTSFAVPIATFGLPTNLEPGFSASTRSRRACSLAVSICLNCEHGVCEAGPSAESSDVELPDVEFSDVELPACGVAAGASVDGAGSAADDAGGATGAEMADVDGCAFLRNPAASEPDSSLLPHAVSPTASTPSAMAVAESRFTAA